MAGATLLEPRLLGRLERLQLGTRRRLAGALAGDHRSPNRGASIDFADYRQYHPGDDFRRIDYHLYARLDLLMVKLFEAEDDLTLRLFIDTSASMSVGGKLLQAKRLAAALGFVALVRRDPVIVHTFPVDRPGPRFIGRSSAWALFDHIDALTATGPTTFATAVTHLLAKPGPPGLTVVISDLLTNEWEEGLRRLPARGGDVVVVHVLGREDMSPSLLGDLDLVDVETGRSVAVSLSPEVVASYEREALEWVDRVATRCRHVGAAVVRIMADDDLEPALLGGWRTAGVVR
jgi:uncharacterized protein (DUF58 family)